MRVELDGRSAPRTEKLRGIKNEPDDSERVIARPRCAKSPTRQNRRCLIRIEDYRGVLCKVQRVDDLRRIDGNRAGVDRIRLNSGYGGEIKGATQGSLSRSCSWQILNGERVSFRDIYQGDVFRVARAPLEISHLIAVDIECKAGPICQQDFIYFSASALRAEDRKQQDFDQPRFHNLKRNRSGTITNIFRPQPPSSSYISPNRHAGWGRRFPGAGNARSSVSDFAFHPRVIL